ncbi:MAG: type II toxin-antitoxin system HicB family antitoxin [Alphaproteobacteria bacterium]
MLKYPVKFTKDGDTLLVTSPDFPELTTFGETREEAKIYAIDALTECIAGRIAMREDIPEPSKGRNLIELPLQESMKVLLWQAMKRKSVNKSELARRLGCHMPQVDRLFSLSHGSKIPQIEAAFKALEVEIDVRVH